MDVHFPASLRLQRSFAAHDDWPSGPHLLKGLNELGVDTLRARLPLHRISSCTVSRAPDDDSSDSTALVVHASANAQAQVARVAEAVRRWGGVQGLCEGQIAPGLVHVRERAWHFEAVLRTMGPVLSALPQEEQQCRHVCVFCVHYAWRLDYCAPEDVRPLCQALPPSVQRLSLYLGEIGPDAWGALLPSLPATVEQMWTCSTRSWVAATPPSSKLMAVCRAATRRVTVGVWLPHENCWRQCARAWRRSSRGGRGGGA